MGILIAKDLFRTHCKQLCKMILSFLSFFPYVEASLFIFFAPKVLLLQKPDPNFYAVPFCFISVLNTTPEHWHQKASSTQQSSGSTPTTCTTAESPKVLVTEYHQYIIINKVNKPSQNFQRKATYFN